MARQVSRHLLALGVFGAFFFTSLPGSAQINPVGPQNGGMPGGTNPNSNLGSLRRASVRVMVADASGGPIDMALVSLDTAGGGMFRQATTEAGQVEFTGIVAGDYSLRVASAGYQTVQQTVNVDGSGTLINIVLRPDPSRASSGASGPPAMPVLAPKVQKIVAKAVDALRAGKPEDALPSLEQAYRLAPGHPYVNYVYGVYFSRLNDWPDAASYWQKAVDLFPKYGASLIFLSEALLRQNKPADAVPYLQRAIELDPSSWRPHAMLAQALLAQRHYDDSVHEADRALELGHAQAATVQPLLAQGLIAQGNKDRAITVLQNYLHDRPNDSTAQKMLASLHTP